MEVAYNAKSKLTIINKNTLKVLIFDFRVWLKNLPYLLVLGFTF